MISIRRALPEEASRLTQICLAAKRHWKYPEAWIEQWVPQLSFSAAYVLENEVWAAVDEDAPVGFYSFKQDGANLWLENLWIAPEAMGKGIGAQLFHHALEQCRAKQSAVLKVESDPNARGFYEKMGAVKIDERIYEIQGQLRVLPVFEVKIAP
ncbi:MAG: GNAT family N-acetyltransferase [Chloroflexi bacterium]|nr:GNAT family N-acetyltransferase [Chloroflexota bacterium]